MGFDKIEMNVVSTQYHYSLPMVISIHLKIPISHGLNIALDISNMSELTAVVQPIS